MRDGRLACLDLHLEPLAGFEDLAVEVPAVYLPRPRVEIPGPQGIQASFDWQAAKDATAGHMCRVTLVNAVEAY